MEFLNDYCTVFEVDIVRVESLSHQELEEVLKTFDALILLMQ
jgi:hypothetical protein